MSRVTPALWSLALALLMLGGALGPGYVLSYDMVWVPDLALGRDALGLGTALPRAVPSDATVAVLDELVPAVLVQKTVLLAPLVAAGAGAAALAGREPVARLVAASLAVWNPFVVERLAIGHWPVLIGYGVLPWVVLRGVEWRRTGRVPSSLPVLVLVGSLSASTGMVTALAALAAVGVRHARRTLVLLGLVLVANVPWLVAGLLRAGDATSSSQGATVFAPSGEGLLPAPVAFLTLGGIWNAQVVPESRTGWLAVASTVLVVGLCLAGVAGARAAAGDRLRPLVVCWVAGMALTVLLWALPAPAGWVASHVPGGGVLRDGSRLLALAAPLVAVLGGRGAAVLVRRLPDVFSRVTIACSLAVAPVALMPDAALALGGRLDAVHYPAEYDVLAGALADLPAGDGVLLPFASYRAPEWNDGGRPVVAPLGRYPGRQVVVNDVLLVDGEPIGGEDRRAAEVAAALGLADPGDRAAGLRSAGIRYVIREVIPGVDAPEVAGTEVLATSGLRLQDLGPAGGGPSTASMRTVGMGSAWVLWCSVPVLSLILARRRRHVDR